MPKPYSAAEMVLAVEYLLARLSGDTSLACPDGLEVFPALDKGVAPVV
jgi:hypothetical protein